ncbi:MAG TPA: hypothetical protein ENJ08_01980 [Gammaproteobacteria bacterium]|nr:hypothetical protein [Gammaproteobacteria bacterium]
MVDSIYNVRPGDVISSDLINSIMDKISELNSRVVELERGVDESNVRIISFSPPNQIEVGGILSVSGKNFSIPVSLNTVKVSGIQVLEFFSTSTSNKIEFRMPAIPGLPDGGDDLVIEISNANGFDRRLYRVVPAVPVAGNPPEILDVVNDDGSGQPLLWGGFIKINGNNFAENPDENDIKFLFNQNSLTSPQLDSSGSGTNQIRLALPEFDMPVMQSVTVEISLKVGAHPDERRSVVIFRPPS